MQEDIYKKNSYKNLVKLNAHNTIEFLLSEGIDFAIATYTNIIKFNPPIPKDIIEFDKKAIFSIGGYTKESAIVTENMFIIEAGFGRENFGSTLSIPLESIFQIIYKEDILHISYFKPKPIIQRNSMEALLNNPENQKLIKKKITKK